MPVDIIVLASPWRRGWPADAIAGDRCSSGTSHLRLRFASGSRRISGNIKIWRTAVAVRGGPKQLVWNRPSRCLTGGVWHAAGVSTRFASGNWHAAGHGWEGGPIGLRANTCWLNGLWVLLLLLLATGAVVLLSTAAGAVVLLSTVAGAVVLLSTAVAVLLLLERRRLGEHRLGLWGCSFSSPFWKSEISIKLSQWLPLTVVT